MNKNFWDDFGRAVTGAADTVTKKAGKVADMARLKNQVYSLERENKKDFEAIGKIVYERQAAWKMRHWIRCARRLPAERF